MLMRKSLFFFLACVVAIAAAIPVSAQGLMNPAQASLQMEKQLPGKRSQVMNPKANEQLPLFLRNKRMMVGQQSPIQAPLKRATLLGKRAPQAPGEYVPTIFSNVVYNDFAGFVSFTPNDTTLNKLKEYTSAAFNSGWGVVDGKLCGVYFIDFGFGQVFQYFSVDINTWEVVDEPTDLQDTKLIAMATAQDPNSGEVFGEFMNSAGNGYEFGIIDYKTLTRTTIATAQQVYVVMGSGKDGFAYGVADDGNLYKIDRTTGAETLVGSTGLTLKNSQGKAYYQSATVDPKTGTFYWAAADAAGVTTLYTVDLATAAITRVNDLATATYFQLMIPNPIAEDDAPAAVEELNAAFEGAALTGTVTFKAPAKNFAGTADLTGNLDWHLLVNGTEKATGTVQPGANVTNNVTVEEGVNKIEVYVNNDKGDGPKTEIETYAGYDQPLAPAAVNFTLSGERHAIVTWSEPTGSVHGGFLGTIKYNVYRISGTDTVKVADGIEQRTFEEDLPNAALATYVYGVEAVNNTQVSDLALSNGQVVGKPFEVPYFDDFNNDISVYTVLDLNNDGSTWSWDSMQKSIRYKYSTTNAGDDWLITPPINLKAGKSYKVSYRARGNGAMWTERMEVKWGKAATVEAMTGEITPVTEFKDKTYKAFEKDIVPTEDGVYFIGFHAMSDPNKFYIYVDSVAVELNPELSAPDAPSNLTATADPTGATKVTIAFNAPDKTIDGNPLANIAKIEVKRGNELIKTLENVAPGSKQTVVDEQAMQGYNKYTVLAYNEQGKGKQAEVTVYAGIDYPTTPKVTAVDQTNSVALSWEQVTGLHGGVIIPEQVRYDIHNVVNKSVGDSIGSVTGQLNFTVNDVQTNVGPQSFMQFCVRAVTTAGPSYYGVGSFVVGVPYTLPYSMSFKNGSVEGKFVGLKSSSDQLSIYTTTDVAQDNDGGSAYYTASAAGECAMLLGKMDFAGATAPKLTFFYQAPGGTPAKLRAEIQHQDGTIDAVGSEIDLASATGDWQLASFDLPASLAEEAYGIVRIMAVYSAGTTNKVYVDNIKVMDPLQKDASIELTAPEKLTKGQTVTMNVKVKNEGLDDVTDATVNVTVNGKAIVTGQAVGKTLKTEESADIPVTYKSSTLDTKETLEVEATVVLAGDLKPENNTAKATIAAEAADVPAPTNLKAVLTGNATVALTWDSPATGDITVTDDFESYEAWGLDFGDWTTYDGDKGMTGGLSESWQYPHEGEKWAFINWEPNGHFAPSDIDPHSGMRAPMAVYSFNESGQGAACDNWLISPRLSGKAQTVTFWVNNGKVGNESFEVLASTTDNEPASFAKQGDTYTQTSGKWTQISVDLPEGTTYFAIRQITDGDQAFIFTVDDATYQVTTAPAGYNVYRDGEFVAMVTETAYTDTEVGQKYQVTAVYDGDVESAPTEATVTSGVNDLVTTGAKRYNVYTIDGRQVMKDAKSLKGLEPGIYIVNGKKKVIRK